MTVEERFWSKVKKTETCWLWTAAKLPTGYGRFCIKKPLIVYAHRFSYELENGLITNGLNVLHKCDNPSCVNPKHLFLGTQLDNMEDAKIKGRIKDKESHWNSKLNIKDVENIKTMHNSGLYTYKQIGDMYGICAPHAFDIVNNNRWKELLK